MANNNVEVAINQGFNVNKGSIVVATNGDVYIVACVDVKKVPLYNLINLKDGVRYTDPCTFTRIVDKVKNSGNFEYVVNNPSIYIEEL